MLSSAPEKYKKRLLTDLHIILPYRQGR